jgi:hypothetical protein
MEVKEMSVFPGKAAQALELTTVVVSTNGAVQSIQSDSRNINVLRDERFVDMRVEESDTGLVGAWRRAHALNSMLHEKVLCNLGQCKAHGMSGLVLASSH